MTKDPYDTLGIARDADLSKIKKAYRNGVKKAHPDTGGPKANVERFSELCDAYETLADEHLKNQFDETTRKKNAVKINRENSPSAKWLPPRARSFKAGHSLFMDFFSHSLDSDHFTGNFETFGNNGLNFEAILTIAEARKGGIFPISLPIRKICPDCGGKGYQYGDLCPNCLGHGFFQFEKRFRLRIPPGVRNGSLLTVPVEGSSFIQHNIQIRILIFRISSI